MHLTDISLRINLLISFLMKLLIIMFHLASRGNVQFISRHIPPVVSESDRWEIWSLTEIHDEDKQKNVIPKKLENHLLQD